MGRQNTSVRLQPEPIYGIRIFKECHLHNRHRLVFRQVLFTNVAC
jgi:hypothetical protein